MKKFSRALMTFSEDDARWTAVKKRDRNASGQFFYAVLTTGIYCRPGCPARLPRRENVRFYRTVATAEKAGYRACRRCNAGGISIEERQAALIERACQILE